MPSFGITIYRDGTAKIKAPHGRRYLALAPKGHHRRFLRKRFTRRRDARRWREKVLERYYRMRRMTS